MAEIGSVNVEGTRIEVKTVFVHPKLGGRHSGTKIIQKTLNRLFLLPPALLKRIFDAS